MPEKEVYPIRIVKAVAILFFWIKATTYNLSVQVK